MSYQKKKKKKMIFIIQKSKKGNKPRLLFLIIDGVRFSNQFYFQS